LGAPHCTNPYQSIIFSHSSHRVIRRPPWPLRGGAAQLRLPWHAGPLLRQQKGGELAMFGDFIVTETVKLCGFEGCFWVDLFVDFWWLGSWAQI